MTEQVSGAAAPEASPAAVVAEAAANFDKAAGQPNNEPPNGGEGGEGAAENTQDNDNGEGAEGDEIPDPSNPRGVKAAFTRVTNQRKAAEQALEAERQKARDFEIENARLKGRMEGQNGAEPKGEDVNQGGEALSEPDPEDFEKYPMGRYDKQYALDLHRWAKSQTDQETARETAIQSVHEQGRQRFVKAVESAKANKATPNAEAFLKERNAAGDKLLIDAISAAENPAALAQYLHANPEEMAKLDAVAKPGTKVTPTQAAEFNRILGRLDVIAPQKLGAANVTKAGQPPDTVGGSRGGGVSVPSDPEDFRAWLRVQQKAEATPR